MNVFMGRVGESDPRITTALRQGGPARQKFD
jgi:hypothetical protein